MKQSVYVLFLSLLVLTATLAQAQTTFTVTNTNDAGSNSLRQAMTSVMNSGSTGPFTINVTATGTINLASVLPDITKDIAFVGPGASSLTIRRSSGGNYGIFNIPNTTTVSFNGFTIADGFAEELDGGAINNQAGIVTVSNCTFRDNEARYCGGAIQNLNELTVTNSVFINNTMVGSGSIGGAIGHKGSLLQVTNSTFSNNSVGSSGGAICVYNGSATITNCLFKDNQANIAGGGIIFRADAAAIVTNCTFSGNNAGGQGNAISDVENIQLVKITNTTIAGNTGNNGALGVNLNAVPPLLKNCIVAGNSANVNPDIFGPVDASSSYNVIGTGGSGDLTNGVNNNKVGVDALLSALGNYGGPRQTYALLPGSPAINAGTAVGAPTTDDRGISRVGVTDVGSFESRGFAMALTSGNNQSAPVNTVFANPLVVTVSSANSEPVAGGVVTFTGPGSGASINPASITASIGTATASASVTANATVGGAYGVTASANGASPARTFNLTNTIGAPTITSFTTVDNTVCVGSSITFTATIGNVTASYNYTLTNGTSTTTGTTTSTAFSQNLTAAGSGNQTFTLTISDNSQSASATTNVTVNSLPTAGLTNNGPLSCTFTTVTLTASGGNSYTFANGSGSVLAGSGNTRLVTVAGTYSVTVANASGCVSTTTTTVTSTTATVSVSNPVTTNATQGTAFNQTFTASGGTAPRSFSLASGSLPNGLSLNSTTGVLSGTPTQSGSFPITVRATDANGCSGVGSTYTLVVNAAAPTITGFTVNPNSVCLGKPITVTATVGNVTGSYSFTLEYSNHIIFSDIETSATFTRGLATQVPGSQTLILTVSANGQSTSAVTNVTINSLPTANLSNNGPLSCTLASVTLTASGGSSYTFTNGIGTVLAGSGNTRSVSTPGTYSVTVANASGCVSTTSTTVTSTTATVSVTNPATTTATQGTAFSQSFTASGGVTPLTFSLASGTLPANLSLNATTGVLSGTPTGSGNFSFTVRATDANGCSGVSATYILVVSEACTNMYTVTNTNDAGAGSLRQAMLNIATTSCPGPFTITASLSGTINLASALPDISRDVTFIGPGASSLTVRRNSGGNYRIFNILRFDKDNNDNIVSFNGFTIANGFANQDNGGGIQNDGILTLTNCTILNNTATYDAGGVRNQNRLTVIDCRFDGNSAGTYGGGLAHGGDFLSVAGSVFINNTTISNGSNGGGAHIGATNSTITDCLFTNNAAVFGGGGVATRASTTFVNCTFSNNTTTGTNSTVGGGAIRIVTGDATFINTTVAFNKSSAGGGVLVDPGSSGSFKNCIIAGNTNPDGSLATNITNSGTISSSSYNVIGTGGSGGLTDGVNNNIVGVNALLAPLGNYGGATQTHALLPGSPAINAGTSSGAPTTDTRGISRVGTTDIGSFESRGFTLALTSGSSQSATVGTAFTSPLRTTVSSANSEPVDGGVVTYTGPGSGAGLSPGPVSATIVGGIAEASVTANATAGGPYTVAATARGASPIINFSLTNTSSTPTLAGFAASPNSVCAGSPVMFTATVGNVTGSYNYTLTNGSSPLTGSASGNFSQNLTASGSGVQNYTLTVSSGGPAATAVASLTVAQSGVTRLYVKANASGANTGLSWQDAFTDLQSALKYSCTGNLREIWIARGVYTPRSEQISDAFSMLPDVAIYGGFEGTETDLSQRPPITASNPSSTTLSADIDSDGTPANNTAYIIYNTRRLTSTAILDGAVIAQANYAEGGGIGTITNVSSGDPTYTEEGQPVGNESSPQYRNLLFTGYLPATNTERRGFIFVANRAVSGGITKPSFINCVFRDNPFGMISNQGTSGISTVVAPQFVNCIIANNTNSNGPNLPFLTVSQSSSTDQSTFINCSFLNVPGGVTLSTINSADGPSQNDIQLTNCVLWNTGGASTFSSQVQGSNPTTTVATTVQYSLLDQAITGYTSGPGNLTATGSPFVSASDVSLPNTSSAVNAGNPASVTVANGPYSATSLPATDAAANPRIVGSRVDMGALEVQNPVAPTPTIADFLANPDPLCVGVQTTFTASLGNITGSYAYTLTNGTSTTTGNSSNTAFSQPLMTTQSGIQTFTLTVSNNGQLATATYVLTVNAPPTISLQASHGGQLTCAVNSLTLTAEGGDDYRFSGPGIVSQDAENGLAIVNAAGVYSVTVAYSETGCFSTTTTTITSATTLVAVTNPATTTATVGQPFSQSFSASGGSGTYSFSVVSSNLPASLSLSSTGVLSGTPTQAGSYTLLVSAQDQNGCAGVASTVYSLTVSNAAPPCGTVVYVTQAGAGSQNGSNWANAFAGTSLQTAINTAAGCGAQVWIAQGLYKPTTGTDRTISFSMKEGVAIYGGFVGTESQLSQRPAVNPVTGQPSSSTLSGDIGTQGDEGQTSDNSFHLIVNNATLTNQAVLDGFVLTLTSASYDETGTSRGFGGAIFNSGKNSSSSPSIRNCLFVKNFADDEGGAIYTLSSSPTIDNCRFENNIGNSQGGAMAFGGGGSPLVKNSSFLSNFSNGDGGVFYIDGPVNLTVQNSTMRMNQTGSGGVLFVSGNNGSRVEFTDCLMEGNTADDAGVMNTQSYTDVILTRCQFLSNKATDGESGVLYIGQGSLTATDCLFKNNSATEEGGAIYCQGDRTKLTNCIFQDNSSQGIGGALSVNSPTTLINCSFIGNKAYRGGAIYCGDLTITNSSFLANQASEGGAICSEGGDVKLTNSVLWNNGGPNSIVYPYGGDQVSASYSLFDASVTGYIDGGNNLTTTISPFVSTTATQLRDCSPAINTGSNAAYSAVSGPSTDLAGATRQYNDGVIDRGAYEYQGNPTTLTVSNPATTTTATVGQLFSQSFSASGGSGTYSFSVVSSNLPASLSLSSTGVLSGTPTQAGSYTLLVSAQDANGCGGVASTVYSLQVIDQTPTVVSFASGSSTVCVGSPVAFTASVANITGSYTYTLTNGTSTTTGNSNNATFSQTLTATGSGVQTFTLTVVSAGQSASATTVITVSGLPTASLVSSGTLTCAVTSVTLTASGGSSYTFTNGSGVVGTPGSASTLVVSTPGTYSVIVANASGCTTTTSTSVQSATGTVAVSSPTTTTATLNSAFSQSFVASGGTGSYSFSLASGSLPNGLSLNPTSGVVSGTPTQPGSFPISVRATDANGCSGVSATYTLVITDPTPTLVGLSASPSAVCVGSPVTFSASVGNVSGSYAYTLSNGQGTPITGTTSATTFSQNLTAIGTGSQSYTLTVSANGQRVTATANLTINSLPVASLVSSGTLTCAVTSVTLTASGGSSYTFTNASGVVGTPGSASTLVVSTPGAYSVTVANASGCTTTTSTSVDQQLSLPTPSLTNTGPLSCSLTSVTLTAGGGTTYRFSPGTSPLAAANQVSVSVAGVYSVTVVGANGCSAVASTTVTGSTQPPTAPTLQASATTTINQPISVTASGCSGSLNWTLLGGTGMASGSLYTVSNPGNYTLSATCSLGGCTSPAASLTLSIQASNEFRVVAPDYDCQTGAITFHTAGGDGSPVEYFAVGITGWTTNPEQYTDRGLRGDPKKVTLQARQNGITVSYVFDLPAYCAGLPTPPQSSTNPAPILVNPIASQVTTQYQPYSFTIPAGTFTDPQGEPLTYAVLGLTPGLIFSGMTISGTPTTAGRPTITVIAVDPSGQTANTSFSLSINPPNPPAPSADPFELSVAAYDCSLGWITLQTSGGTGTPVEYRIEGVTDWTSNANLVIPLSMRQSASIGLKARQGGVEVSLVFDAAAACGPTPPDLTPVLYARPSTMSSQPACSVVVDVVEVAGVATTGPITVMISKDPKMPLSFDAGLTSVGGMAVQNSVWSLDTSRPNYYVLTTNQVIARSQKLSVGLTGVLQAGSTTGRLTVSATVVGGSGGETQLDNNTDADKIEYFPQ
ncbi:putative Ig domain-containing protein [Spirosoma koreense]